MVRMLDFTLKIEIRRPKDARGNYRVKNFSIVNSREIVLRRFIILICCILESDVGAALMTSRQFRYCLPIDVLSVRENASRPS